MEECSEVFSGKLGVPQCPAIDWATRLRLQTAAPWSAPEKLFPVARGV